MKLKQYKYPLLPGVICIIAQLVTYYLPMLLNVEPQHWLSSRLDEAIPVVPVFVFIYVSALIMWIMFYGFIFAHKALAWRFLTADLLCKVVCIGCFFLYPCTLTRPEEFSGAGAWALRILYSLDKPTNLLPSMHCYMSWLCIRPMLDNLIPNVKKSTKAILVIYALSICLSTLFTKQHVVVDVITGLALAEIMWRLSDKIFKRGSKL